MTTRSLKLFLCPSCGRKPLNFQNKAGPMWDTSTLGGGGVSCGVISTRLHHFTQFHPSTAERLQGDEGATEIALPMVANHRSV